MVKHLYMVVSKSDGQFDADPRWRESLRSSVICPRCGDILPQDDPQPIDVRLVSEPTRSVTLKRLFRVSIIVAARQFLSALAPVRPRFIVGVCALTSGTELGDYASCFLENRIDVYGGVFTHYNRCSTCHGLLVQLPMAETPDPQYVWQDELRDSHVYMSRCGGLLVDDVARRCIGCSQFPDLEFDPVLVRTRPAT